MNNLDYKGVKSTRLEIAFFILLISSMFLAHSYFTQPFEIWLNFFDQWVSIGKWVVGLYAASEIGAKAAEAYRDKP